MILINILTNLITNHMSYTKEIYLLPIIIITPITLAFVFILLAGCCKKNTKDFKIFIFLTIFFATLGVTSIFFQDDIIYYPSQEYKINLKENEEYTITITDDLTSIQIMIHFKENVSTFKYNMIFYNKDNEIVKAESDEYNNISQNSYKTLTFDKPTSITINGGKYNFQHEMYKEINQKAKIVFENHLFFLNLSLSTMASLIYLQNLITPKNNLLCPKCKTKIKNNTKFCPKCGTQLNNDKED